MLLSSPTNTIMPKAKLSAPLPLALEMHLRPVRATAPGAPDKPKAKRLSAVVKAEKDEKAKEKQEKHANKVAKLKKLAELEEKMLTNDKDTDLIANNPPIAKKEKKSSREASGDTAPESV